MSKPIVIYHNADYDGLFCREIARKFLHDAELFGWNYGDPKVKITRPDDVFILDLNPDCIETTFGLDRLIWIDHHKTAIEKWSPSIVGYRIDGVAACRLTWQWFSRHHSGDGLNMPELASKEDFVNRSVMEPIAVRLAGEYDIWDKRDPRADTFQYALRASNQENESFESLLCYDADSLVEEMLKFGAAAQHYTQRTDASICNHRSFLVLWEGLSFLALNTAWCNSLTFSARDNPQTGHDALMGFYWNGINWNVSLYHAKHRTDIDLSEIAKAHGGGGHRGACGFRAATLPFV